MCISGDLNSVPKACTANTLVPEPSSQHATGFLTHSGIVCWQPWPLVLPTFSLFSHNTNYPDPSRDLCSDLPKMPGSSCGDSYPHDAPAAFIATIWSPFRTFSFFPAPFKSPCPQWLQQKPCLSPKLQMSPSVMQNKYPCPQMAISLRTRISRLPILIGDVSWVVLSGAIAECKGQGCVTNGREELAYFRMATRKAVCKPSITPVLMGLHRKQALTSPNPRSGFSQGYGRSPGRQVSTP